MVDRNKMEMKELKIVRNLLNELNNNILYCHWKSNEHFKDALTGKDDLDILINRSQYGQLVNILQKLKFKRFYVPNARSYIGIEDYLGFDYETGKLVHLHLHSQLVIGEKHLKGFLLPIEQRILKNRRWDDKYGAYLSSYFDELLLLIIRTGMKTRKRDIIKNNLLSGTTKDEFLWLKDKCVEFGSSLKEQTWLTERLANRIEKIYITEIATWNDANRLKCLLYKDLAPYSQGNKSYNTLRRNYRELLRIILEIEKRYLKAKNILTRRRPATGGVIIAFLGSDGAGKSTAIKEIYNWLFQFMDVRFFYLGSGDGRSSVLRKPLKFLLKIAQKKGFVKKSNNFNNEKLAAVENKKLVGMRKLWVYTLSKERIRKLKAASRCRMRGFIVLTDRYPQNEYDGLCDGRRLRKQGGISEKMEEKCFRIAEMCPPDLAIKMIVPPEIAVARKPGEIDIETSRNLTERVKHIKFSDRTCCTEIDSGQSQETVWLNIKRAIWEAI